MTEALANRLDVTTGARVTLVDLEQSPVVVEWTENGAPRRGEADLVRLTVVDDGEATAFDPRSASGFGLVGMAERAKLLGGTFEAGPNQHRGWTVDVGLPRGGRGS